MGQHLLSKILSLGSTPKYKEYEPKIKGSGKQFDKLTKMAEDLGLELYADTICKCYWIWKDGNSFDGTRDPFYRLSDAETFLKQYKKQTQ